MNFSFNLQYKFSLTILINLNDYKQKNKIFNLLKNFAFDF